MQALQCAESLLITHRLDACTEGLLVVGRNRPFVQHFNRLLQRPGAVRKFYKALTQHPPPTGASFAEVKCMHNWYRNCNQNLVMLVLHLCTTCVKLSASKQARTTQKLHAARLCCCKLQPSRQTGP